MQWAVWAVLSVGALAQDPDRDWSLINNALANASLDVDGQFGPMTIPVDVSVLPGVSANVDTNVTVQGPFNVGGLYVGEIAMPSTAQGDNAVTTQVSVKELKMSLFISEMFLDINGSLTILGFPSPLNVKANGSIQMDITVGLEVGLRVEANESLATTPPERLLVESCDGSGTSLDLNCTGNWPSITILGTDYPICTLMTGFINVGEIVCNLLEAPNTTAGISRIMTDLSKLVKEAESKPPAPPVPAEETEAFLKGMEGLSTITNTTAVEGMKLMFDSVYAVPGSPPNDDSLVATQFLSKAFPGGLRVEDVVLFGPFLGFEIEIHEFSVRMGGVDKFDLLQMSGNFTSAHDIGVKWMAMDFALDVVAPGLRDRFSMSFNSTDLDIHMRLLTALRPALFNPLPLGGLVGSGLMTSLDCLVIPMEGFKLTDLSMAFKEIVKLEFDATLVEPPLGASGGLNALTRDIIGSIGMTYGPTITIGMPLITRAYIGPLMSNLLNQTAQNSDPAKCKVKEDPQKKKPAIIDFNENIVTTMMNFILNVMTGSEPDSDTGINTAIRKMTVAAGMPPGKIVLNGTVGGVVLDQPIPGTPEDLNVGIVEMYGGNMTLEIAPFETFKLFGPAAPCNGTDENKCHTLSNDMTFRQSSPFLFSADARLKIGGSPAGSLDDWFRMTASFDALSLLFDLKALIDAPELSNLTVGQITDPGCFLATLSSQGLGFPQAGGSLDQVRMEIDCESDFHSCTGYVLQEWSDGLNSPVGLQSLREYANKGMQYIGDTLTSPQTENTLNGWINTAVCTTRPPAPVPAPSGWKEYSDGGWLSIAIFMILPNVVVLIVVLIYTACKLSAASRQRRLLPPRNSDASPAGSEEDDEEHWFVALGFHESLFWHPAVSPLMKWGVPLMILAAAGVMVSAQMAEYMVQINMKVLVAGDQLELLFLNFSTVNIVKDSWGDWSMFAFALLVGVMGGAFPYIKFMLLLWLWFVPTSVISLEARSTQLWLSDYFCKWSLVDVFLSSMLIVIIFCPLSFPDSWQDTGLWVPGLMGGGTEGKVGWGCWGVFVAQVMNLILARCMVMQHRNVMIAVRHATDEEDDEASPAGKHKAGTAVSTGKSTAVSMASTSWFQYGAENTVREPLRGHVFKGGFISKILSPFFEKTGRRRVRVNILGRIFVFFSIMAIAALLITGTVIPFVGTKYQGAIRLMTELMEPNPTDRDWTFFGLVHDYTQLAEPNGAVMFVAALFVGSAFVVPLLACSTLLILWVAPMTLSAHKKALFVCECLYSWSTIDVIALVTLIVNLKADLLVNFSLGSKGTYMNSVVQQLADMGIRLNEGTPLFMVMDGWMRPGWYSLCVMAVLSNFIYIVLHTAAVKAIEDREWAIGNPRGRNRLQAAADPDDDTGSEEDDERAGLLDVRSPRKEVPSFDLKP